MNKLLCLSFIAVGLYCSGQNVGVNTSSPVVTLDVTGKPTDPSKLDGITAPRLTGVQLRAKTYTNLQTGALVYVSVADTNPSGQTIDVTKNGYYYFNGDPAINKWIFVGNTSNNEPWYSVNTGTGATLNTENIYQSGRVAIGASTLNNGGKLNVNGGIRVLKGDPTNDASDIGYTFENDGDTGIFASGGTSSSGSKLKLTVDKIATANITTTGVGIGTDNPETRLDVVGPSAGSAIKIVDGTQGDRKVLKSAADGKASWQQMLRPKPNGNTDDVGPYTLQASAPGTPNAIDANTIQHISITPQNTGWYVIKSRFYFQAQAAPNDLGYFWININDHPTDINGGEIMYEYRSFVHGLAGSDSASPPSGSLVGTTYYLHYKTINTRLANTGERRLILYFLE